MSYALLDRSKCRKCLPLLCIENQSLLSVVSLDSKIQKATPYIYFFFTPINVQKKPLHFFNNSKVPGFPASVKSSRQNQSQILVTQKKFSQVTIGEPCHPPLFALKHSGSSGIYIGVLPVTRDP